MLAKKRKTFRDEVSKAEKKEVFYMSMEFLVGTSLRNNLFNLGIEDTMKKLLAGYGFDIEHLYSLDPDAGLGGQMRRRLRRPFERAGIDPRERIMLRHISGHGGRLGVSPFRQLKIGPPLVHVQEVRLRFAVPDHQNNHVRILSVNSRLSAAASAGDYTTARRGIQRRNRPCPVRRAFIGKSTPKRAFSGVYSQQDVCAFLRRSCRFETLASYG